MALHQILLAPPHPLLIDQERSVHSGERRTAVMRNLDIGGPTVVLPPASIGYHLGYAGDGFFDAW